MRPIRHRQYPETASTPPSRFPRRLARRLGTAALLVTPALWASGFLPTNTRLPYELPLLWPEDQRAFLQDGPGLLLSREQTDELTNLDVVGRQRFIDEFLRDPLPETEENELVLGIAERRALVRRELMTFLDARAQVLFLHGPPRRREIVDCAETYKPLELWTYGLGEGTFRTLVFYQPKPRSSFRLWLPLDSKRVLYNEEMEYWLEQIAELGRRLRGVRFDYQICPRAVEVDRVTGVSGLFGFMKGRPRDDDFASFLKPPHDIAAWAEEAAAEITALPETVTVDRKEARKLERARKKVQKGRHQVPDDEEFAKEVEEALAADGGEDDGAADGEGDELPDPYSSPYVAWQAPEETEAELELFFPERQGLRMTTRLLIKIPPGVGLEPFVEGEREELRITVEGHLEHDGEMFDSFRVRYLLPPPAEGVPVALAADRMLRPDEEFLLRLKVIDEISGRHAWLNRGFVVPGEPTPMEEMPPVPDEVLLGLTEELKKNRVSGYDSLILVPPESDVIFGLWRAEALVTGSRIQKVQFYVDDELLFTRRRPPFTAEVRLDTEPREQIIRAEGYDDTEELVASDEVILNQPRGELRVRILEPARGRPVVAGQVAVKAEVVVPEEARVEKVEFLLNEDILATVSRPPWEASIEVPPTGELTYITVAATLEGGLRAEDVRFLNAPNQLEEIDVNLVELYTTVTDKSNLLVRGLVAADFEVWEDGAPQEIAKFELVENLPLTMGLAIDTSGSMFESLLEAQEAAVGFLENIITPRDKCFALAFAEKPVLLMPRTSDVGAVAQRVRSTVANGGTSLHDAIVTSLYYYRGIRGRRALVILSDGEDTSSTIAFRDALEYAKKSGVAVYAIGLRIGRANVGVRRKLDNLTEETGGRSIYIQKASELDDAYADIERELRSQYLVAYSSDQKGEPGQYHEVTVKVKGGKLKARTMRGYYS